MAVKQSVEVRMALISLLEKVEGMVITYSLPDETVSLYRRSDRKGSLYYFQRTPDDKEIPPNITLNHSAGPVVDRFMEVTGVGSDSTIQETGFVSFGEDEENEFSFGDEDLDETDSSYTEGEDEDFGKGLTDGD